MREHKCRLVHSAIFFGSLMTDMKPEEVDRKIQEGLAEKGECPFCGEKLPEVYEEGECYLVESYGKRKIWKRGYNFWRYFGGDSANIIPDYDDHRKGKFKIIRKIDLGE